MTVVDVGPFVRSSPVVIDMRSRRAKGDDVTDNWAIFVAAVADLPATGGSLLVFPGKYRFSAKWVIDKPVMLVGYGAGLDGGARSTELTWDTSVDGLVLTTLAKKSTIRDLCLSSAGSGAGVGLRIRGTRARLENLHVTGWGSHGVFLDTAARSPSAGTETGGVATITLANHGFLVGEIVVLAGWTPAAYNGVKTITAVTTNIFSFAIAGGTGNASVVGTAYAGNANLGHLSGVRAASNGGDGIRIEGSDSNVVQCYGCDTTGNTGYGIANLGAKTGVYSPHASGNTAGDYYDAGSSAIWLNPYAEAGGKFVIDTAGSSNGYLLSVGVYAPPTVWSGNPPVAGAVAAVNANWTVIDGNVHQRKIRLKDPAGTKEWQVLSGLLSADSFELRQQTDGKRVFSVTPTGDRLTLGDPVDLDVGATTGTKIGINATRKLGFWGKTPIVQPAGAGQAALTNNTGGATDGTLAAVSGSGADAAINNNFAEVHTLLNAIRTALVDAGLIKGAA